MNDMALVAGFESQETSISTREVGAVAASAREEAEIKAAIFLARQFPRDEAAAYTKIMKSCKRPTLAENASYSFPRGGQTVTGPSVNLAREIARCWGNIRTGLRVVSMDDDTVHIRGYAYDMESNAYVEHEDKFAKLIQRRQKGGGTRWVQPDERDLRELINRRGAILVRNAILQVVPSDIVEEAEKEASRTRIRAAKGDIEQSREDAIRRLRMAFDEIGVTAEMIEEKLGHSIDVITAEEIAELRTIYTSIRDGNSRRDEHFEVGGKTADDAGTSALNARLKNEAEPEAEAEPEQGALV